MTNEMFNQQLIITGGKTISGEVNISGAKNAALPIIAASILASTPSKLSKVPRLLDTISMLELSCSLNCNICMHEDLSISIDPKNCRPTSIEKELAQKTRASFLFLGPLLTKFKKAYIPLPGGCNIGARPIDIHLDGLKKMGATIKIEKDAIYAHVNTNLKGADITLPIASVGATENIIMAASLAEGKTTIYNAAKEPEIEDLVKFINSMGGKIKISNDARTIEIQGVKALHGTNHNIISDRLEAGTYLIAAAITQGEITVKNVNHEHLTIVLEKLRSCGAIITTSSDSIHLKMNSQAIATDITTEPYPGFPTDLQQQWLTLNTIAKGSATVHEKLFENRFQHAIELQKLGASLKIENDKVITQGNDKLKASTIYATDLRAAASLILAALVTKGATVINNIEIADRGYSKIEENFSKLGIPVYRLHLKKNKVAA